MANSMKLVALRKYIDGKNLWLGMAKKPLIKVAFLTDEQAQSLYSDLDCDMSPENVSCDGELSASQVKVRMAYYKAVAADLKSLGFVAKDLYVY